MPPQLPQEGPEELIRDLARAIVTDLTSIEVLNRLGGVSETVLVGVLKVIFGVVFRVATPIATAALTAMFDAAESTAPQRADIMAAALRNVFGIEVDESGLRRLLERGATAPIARAAVPAMIRALTGGSTSIDPSEAPAQRYVEVVLNQALETWFLGTSIELLSTTIPGIEQIQTVGEIGNRIANVLGIGDSSSRVLRPYIDNLVVEPLRRHIDKTYRPTLLTPSLAAQQITRGRGNAEGWREEMRLHGLSEERIEAVLASQQKFLSPEQLSWMEWNELIGRDEAVQTLRDQGYDEQNASKQLNMRRFEREDTINRRIATDAMAAFENRNIEESALSGFLNVTVFSVRERALLRTAARSRRELNITRISKGDIEQAVRASIVPMSAYRRWLTRAGYNEEDTITLELLLRYEIDKLRDIGQHRADLEAERTAERLRRDEERATRKADIEAERALRARGAESDLERAAVRGLIPFARLEEVLAAKYDADTVAILVSIVEDTRQTYLEQQRKADEARQRAARQQLDVGALEQAVLLGTLTVEEFSRHPALADLDAGDRQILIATLRVRKAERDEATAKRREAELAARRRGIDLGRFETLVRRGYRSLAQYDELLRTLGFEDAARAAMRELLELHIADDRAADQARADAEARLRTKGLSLEQQRRAVVLGVQPIDAFERFLIEQGFTADAQAVLLAALRLELAEADAARRRRETADATTGGPRVPLSTIRRAAQLGVISPDVYRARLGEVGYPDDEIELELTLLLTEIADVQAARAKRDAIERELNTKGLSLSEVARAVKAGLQPLELYHARATALGYSREDVATLVRLLGDELRETELAKARRDEIAGELKDRKPTLAELEDAVTQGIATIDDFGAELVRLGYAPADAELLAGLLVDALEATA